jgi:tryptophan synthase alpha chain
VILSDLPPDDSEAWRDAASQHGLDTIFLAAPTSTDQRIAKVAEVSTGFIYCVSRTGVTGTGSQIQPEVTNTVRKIRDVSKLPVCVGFGISTPEHVRMVCEIADGAIIGSHIVNYLCENGIDGLAKEVSRLKAAL